MISVFEMTCEDGPKKMRFYVYAAKIAMKMYVPMVQGALRYA